MTIKLSRRAAASHISLNWDAVSTMYEQYAGLEAKRQY
jgi:hypothetical protein